MNKPSRARVVGVSVAAAALAATTVAGYAVGTERRGTTVTACVSVKTGVMRLERASAPCVTHGRRAVRERRISWNKRGVPGAVGAAGADGASILTGEGAPGDDLGLAGDLYLDTVASRIYGPKTTTWPEEGVRLQGDAGPAGPAGAAGAPGTAGPAGPAGAAGAAGADGTDGTDGAGTTALASGSNGLVTLTTPPGGGTGAGVAVPISGTGSVGSIDMSAPLSQLSPTGPAAVAQIVPANMTLSSFSARGVLLNTEPFFGLASLSITAQLYTAPGSGASAFAPVAGATCTLAPGYFASAVSGTVGQCRVTGLSTALTAGQLAVIVFSATSTASAPPGTTVTALSELLSAGLTLS